MNDINHKLEQKIASLSITKGKKKYLKNQTKYLIRQLKKTSRYTYDYNPQWAISIQPNNLGVSSFWYGGSWDKGVFIKSGFDLDLYIIYDLLDSSASRTPWFTQSRINFERVSGKEMFKMLYDDLNTIKKKINEDLHFLIDPPYNHAIPTQIDFKGQYVDFDCIPAFELPDDYLLVPEGQKDCKKVNLKLEEIGLSKVNKKTNGRATKLIWLLKYWNHLNKKTIKSYIIQRLVEDIFIDKNIDKWDKALKYFFIRAIQIFQDFFKGKKVLKDRVYSQFSILDDYSEKQLQKFYNALRKGNKQAQNGNWDFLNL